MLPVDMTTNLQVTHTSALYVPIVSDEENVLKIQYFDHGTLTEGEG
jgi:hypothetical protein